MKIYWENFRSVKIEDDIEIAPITLVIGKNNVGKSSLYSPLLMLSQTLKATSLETALLGRGAMTDVGVFKDYIRDHDAERELKLRFSLPEIRGESNRTPGRKGNPTISSIETSFASVDGISATLVRQKLLDSEGIAIVNRSRAAASESFTFASPLLPDSKTVGRPKKEITELRRSLRNEQPENFLFSGFGGLLLPDAYHEDPERWEQIREWYASTSSLYEVQRHAQRRAIRALSSIHYVGPIRREATRTYRLTPEPPASVGPDGLHTAEVLFRNRHSELWDKVGETLATMGYGELRFRELSDEYFQILLNSSASRSEANIAFTGTGVSQILPVLVQGFLAERDVLYVTQQPEIHLNPAQQTHVMDFLIERSEAGARILVETHSEHMLLRLRRRIAEGEIDSARVKIYYVENDDRGNSIVRDVPLTDNGEVQEGVWPKGFFGERMHDAFQLALAQSRSARKVG